MFFAEELLHSEQKLSMQTLRALIEKVSAVIMMVINTFGYKNEESKLIDLGVSLRELANFATITYPTLSKVLDTLKKEGVIGIIENELCVLDEDALNNLARM